MRTSRRLRSRRGFTLVELMVSLVAGLVIATAVVGLARAATTTFHEQARLTNVEMTVRSASERLRADLLRVSYMSTGNIHLARNDSSHVPFGQKISHEVGGDTSRYGADTDNLQGIRILHGGSLDSSKIATAGANANNLSTNNNLLPDAVLIAGNMTSDDAYRATWLGTGTCAGPRLVMTVAGDAAVQRLINGAATVPVATANVQNVFTPIPGPNYLARVVDPRGCEHYVEVCNAVALSAGVGATVAIDLRPDATGKAILTKAQDASTCGGEPGEVFSINPVHRVRWYVGPNTDVRLDGDPNVDPIANKFNLYREMLDAAGAPLPAPGIREIVAEYAVDLQLGVTVDDPAAATPADRLKVFDGAGWMWTRPASTTAVNGPGPQRVRSVHYRIAVRAPIPDRDQPLFVIMPPTNYLTRYCLEDVVATTAATTCKKFARVRMLASEVALMNQAGMSY